MRRTDVHRPAVFASFWSLDSSHSPHNWSLNSSNETNKNTPRARIIDGSCLRIKSSSHQTTEHLWLTVGIQISDCYNYFCCCCYCYHSTFLCRQQWTHYQEPGPYNIPSFSLELDWFLFTLLVSGFSCGVWAAWSTLLFNVVKLKGKYRI